MKKHWKFSRHFAERFVERFSGDKEKVKEITRFFNDNVLQCVFDCNVYGNPQRVKIEKYKVCFKYDEVIKKILVTTVY